VDLADLEGLDAAAAERLARALGLDERPLRIVVQDERSLPRNQEIAARRLADLVAEALAPPPPPRRPTRPGRARREARLADKARRGNVKRLRQAPTGLD
jgi:ribosome-associated protein